MILEKKIGYVVRDIRISNGLSQTEFAESCGIDKHYLSNVENGQRNVSVDVISRICIANDLLLSQFFSKVEQYETVQTQSLQNCESIQKQFVAFMRSQHLSQATITKYSETVPNKLDVQLSIKRITGTTQNIYNVTDLLLLEKIIEDVASTNYDRAGQRMYSCGLKKYLDFIKSNSNSF